MQHTGLKLSKLLAKNGCKLESEMYWSDTIEFVKQKNGKLKIQNVGFKLKKFPSKEKAFIDSEHYRAYDLLWDISIKYAKEFFGNNKNEISYVTETLLLFLQENKIKEAEDYIWEHCKFNNKEK